MKRLCLDRARTILRRSALCTLLLSVSTVSAWASQSAEDFVRAELESFLRSGLDAAHLEANANAEIILPPLSAFRFDRERTPGPLRAEMSTKAQKPYEGRVSVTVMLFAGERLIHRGIVSSQLRVPIKVVVPARNLSRGDVIARKDLKVVSLDRAKLLHDVLLSFDQLVGQRTRRRAREGQPLRNNQVEPVPLVERGDQVIVILESGALQLQATGRAQQKGALGDWIRVLNLDSRKEIQGRVDAAGRVRVLL